MLKRFESDRDIDLSDSQNSDDIIRKFRYWQNRPTTVKQRILLRRWSKEHLGLREFRPRGISEKKGVEKEEIRRHYTVIKSRTGKTRIVARISKGKKGAGRFAKKS